MATDLATTNDGGVSNMAVGSFTGAGADVEVTCGFKPRYVILINLTDRTKYETSLDMTAAHSLKTVAAGTMTDDTSGILLKGSADGYRGFFVPAAIAISAKAMHYIAYG
jgi:hypothetical protein